MLNVRCNGPTFTKYVVLSCLSFLLLGLAFYNLEPYMLIQDGLPRIAYSHDGVVKDAETIYFLNELPFLRHFTNSCDELVIKNHPELSPELRHERILLEEELKRGKFRYTGHTGYFKNQQLVASLVVQLPFVRTVCETGFNAGHSTLVYLASNPNVHVYSFDLDKHYARHMAKYLGGRFNNRLNVTWGDSTKTIAAFHQRYPDIKCDLLSIDGGHTEPVANSDFVQFKKMAAKRNLLLYDDHPNRDPLYVGIGNVWEGKKETGELVELFQCMYDTLKRGHGFSLGRYVHPINNEEKEKPRL